ncbi:hypothetical protein PspLS_11267 [Pyricularia sp. CBS 133598]|nr:hypothetical protein PspLS_11267 [Pyricularia sp. CBS 133598]
MRFETTIIGLLAAATTAVAISVPPQAAVAGGLIARQEEMDDVDMTPSRVKREAEEDSGDDEQLETRDVEHDDPDQPGHSEPAPAPKPPVEARDEAPQDQVDDSADVATAESDDDASADQDSSDEGLNKRDDKDKKDNKHTDGDSHDAASHKAGGKNMTNMPNMTMPGAGGAKGAASSVGVSVMLGTVLGGAALFMAL